MSVTQGKIRLIIEYSGIAQSVKAWICNLRIADSSLAAGGVFVWYGPLASPSLHVARVGSDHHLSLLDKSS